MRLLKNFLVAGWLALVAGCGSRDSVPETVQQQPPILMAASFNPKDYHGKILLLNFWATWCPPCRDEIPALVKLHHAFDRNKVAIVGISIDDRGSPEQIKTQLAKFIARYKIDYPIVFDSKMELYKAFGSSSAIPTTFLIDPQGKIKKVYTGSRPFEVFAEDIQAVLDGS